MKVFISFGGTSSKELAKILHEYLPILVQTADPWLSEHDLKKGREYFTHLTENLKNTEAGIFCLTRENIQNTWMHFEAGAIHLYTEENRKESRPVFTLLLDISVDEVKPPLNQFQATIADKDGILKLITELFQHDNPNLDKDRIEKTFEKNWKDIEEKIKDIRKVESSTSSPSKTIISSTNEKVSNLKIGHAGYEVLAEVYKNSDQNTGSTTYVDIKNGLREDIQELQLKVILDVLLLEKYIEKDKLGNISAFKLTNFGKTELIRHLYR